MPCEQTSKSCNHYSHHVPANNFLTSRKVRVSAWGHMNKQEQSWQKQKQQQQSTLAQVSDIHIEAHRGLFSVAEHLHLARAPLGIREGFLASWLGKDQKLDRLPFIFFLNLKVQWSSWTAFWQHPALVSLSGRAMSAPKIQLLLNLWACNILEYPRAILNSGPKICLVDFSYQSRNCQACFKSHQNTSNTFVVNKGNKIKF